MKEIYDLYHTLHAMTLIYSYNVHITLVSSVIKLKASMESSVVAISTGITLCSLRFYPVLYICFLFCGKGDAEEVEAVITRSTSERLESIATYLDDAPHFGNWERSCTWSRQKNVGSVWNSSSQ